ncbi:hypothetical protein F0562_034366 [Nyssa sinensis]|uniref:Uncharacterized protein n=1 Tax=Nyssa sinensis TaxID=561372 RepID=A0A5J5AGW0_9ASTE|nr:hypothetical protein F0562_034366 [Nyssa sinensis]
MEKGKKVAANAAAVVVTFGAVIVAPVVAVMEAADESKALQLMGWRVSISDLGSARFGWLIFKLEHVFFTAWFSFYFAQPRVQVASAVKNGELEGVQELVIEDEDGQVLGAD